MTSHFFDITSQLDPGKPRRRRKGGKGKKPNASPKPRKNLSPHRTPPNVAQPNQGRKGKKRQRTVPKIQQQQQRQQQQQQQQQQQPQPQQKQQQQTTTATSNEQEETNSKQKTTRKQQQIVV